MCTTTCRSATWPRCRCDCGGANHSSDVLSLLFNGYRRFGPDLPPRRSPVASSARDQRTRPHAWSDVRLIGLDLDDLETWLDQNPSRHAQVTALVEAASAADSPRGRSADGQEPHVVCALLVSVVIALEQVEELRARVVDDLAAALTTMALSAVRSAGPLPEPLDTTTEHALAATTRHVVDLVVSAVWPGTLAVNPVTLQNLRIAAILTCPDTDAHREVRDHCVAELAVALLDGTP